MKISVIIPVHNGIATLRPCLESVKQQCGDDAEILVIDDHSTDGSGDLVKQLSLTIIENPRGRGPAAARNVGAENARGEILFFVDSDVVIASDAVSRILRDFEEHSEIVAVFGSYDDQPAERNFLSQYKNLMHHYIHQTSNENAGTFWAGCGAIRSNIFRQVGGFREKEYTQPSIEDIELGVRLKQSGYKILLDKQLQAKHLKCWRAGNLLKADIFCRAIPWSQLILQNHEMPKDLNLKISDRLSGALAVLLLLSLPAIIFRGFTPFIVILGLLLFINWPVYQFFGEKRGIIFAAGTVFWHILYYLYSTITFLYCWLLHIFGSSKKINSSLVVHEKSK